MSDALPDGSRRSRFWLFAPFVLLALVAVAWSVAWFVIRGRVVEQLDAALAREAAAGRQWTCTDRATSGYPFRIEVACSALTLQRGDTRASFGRVVSVAQVYQPRLIIAEVAGPLQVVTGDARIDAQWRLLQMSLHLAEGGFQRASLVASDVRLRGTGVTQAEIAGSGDRLEAHLRPDPARTASEGAYDVAFTVSKAAVPALNEVIGGNEPVDLSADLLVTRGRTLTDGSPIDAAERWRQAGGSLELTRVALAKGARRLEAKGTLGLDDQHRATGRLELAVAGLEDVVARITGVRVGGTGGALLGTLMGGQKPGADRAGAAGDSKLAQLPAVRLENGRVLLGPVALPGVRLAPLY
jgi:hypothetical protein